MSDPNSLLAQVLRTKYEKGNGWGNIQKVANPSFLWSSIHKGIQSLNRNVSWAVVDGKHIRLGIDPWVPGAPDFVPRLNPRYYKRESSLAASLCLHSGRWNKQLILQMFHPEDAVRILKLLPPAVDSKEKLCWCKYKSGAVTVKAVYKLLKPMPQVDQIWKSWRKLKLPPRFLLLGWKIGIEALPMDPF